MFLCFQHIWCSKAGNDATENCAVEIQLKPIDLNILNDSNNTKGMFIDEDVEYEISDENVIVSKIIKTFDI